MFRIIAKLIDWFANDVHDDSGLEIHMIYIKPVEIFHDRALDSCGQVFDESINLYIGDRHVLCISRKMPEVKESVKSFSTIDEIPF